MRLKKRVEEQSCKYDYMFDWSPHQFFNPQHGNLLRHENDGQSTYY